MKLPKSLMNELVVQAGTSADLQHRSTTGTHTDWLQEVGLTGEHEVVDQTLAAFKAELESAQELLYASNAWAVLVVIQALDAAGKDGTISHVMSGVNPQGCSVTSFKQPTAEELGHDFLWRCEKALPERGRIGIFNRSYYEDVLVTQVHPEILTHQHLPPATAVGPKLWEQRYEDINAFESHLTRNGTKVIKVFLHVSKAEQKRRFLERLDDPAKHWKFSNADIVERAFFEDYLRVYDNVLSATSTDLAPWYVVPADHKHAARAIVGGILAQVVHDLNVHIPALTAEQAAALELARTSLLAESE